MPSLSSNTFVMRSGSKSLWQHLLAYTSLALFVFLLISGGIFDGAYGQGQRSGIRQGDRTFQRVASTVDIDERDDKLYRRPPTYLIIASKIVRPSTVYKVCWYSNTHQLNPAIIMFSLLLSSLLMYT